MVDHFRSYKVISLENITSLIANWYQQCPSSQLILTATSDNPMNMHLKRIMKRGSFMRHAAKTLCYCYDFVATFLPACYEKFAGCSKFAGHMCS